MPDFSAAQVTIAATVSLLIPTAARISPGRPTRFRHPSRRGWPRRWPKRRCGCVRRESRFDRHAIIVRGVYWGSGDDRGKSIAVDSLGNADVTGETSSDQTSFPVAIGPDLTYNGAVDAFVAKINAGGTSLVDAGYIGGLNPDRA